ncbi:MAG: hypothetical protein A3F18_01685 [Legionellales bacterium RIFCSPHIGHO2_12_FULL_37_14]|nr:MAG: hypothetical protein A3F18_01685 [Legionellales bacterium RIFCSPHIGHO2_12_FULL_37_14]
MHIILIGFKHVGKTHIGKKLAKALHMPFIDLDKEIATYYHAQTGRAFTPRQIVAHHGEKYFRQLETKVLQMVILQKASILSLGGGTPIAKANQKLIKGHKIFHIDAPRGIIFERIMLGGRPAFFDEKLGAYASFIKLYTTRSKVYTKLTSSLIHNTGTIDEAVKDIIKSLNMQF